MIELSIYTLLFTEDSKFYLYNSRSNFFSEISEELYVIMSNSMWDKLPVEVMDELLRKEFICESKDKFNYYYSQLLSFNARNNDNSVLNLILAPTTACNFACPYCFESRNNPKTIDYETIEYLKAFVQGHKNAKVIHLTWYGGEPLLAFDKMKIIYEKLSSEKMPRIESQSIITNGYLFNDEIIRFFKNTGCRHIQITIDGLYEKHSATRCLKSGNGDTFMPTILNIDKLVNELPQTVINIRVNINKENYKDFIDVANFIRNRYFGNKMISAYPGLIREESEEKRSLCDLSFAPSERLMLHELLRENGYDTSDFPTKSNRGCMMQNAHSYLIGPEGEIYKCWNDVGNKDAIIGSIKQSELFNESRYIKYMAQSMPFNEECRSCQAFPICDGGCSYHRYRNNFEGCNFDLCSPYKDKNKLKRALLSGKYKNI